LIKGIINQEGIKIANIHALNVRSPKFIKETPLDIKVQIDPNAVIVSELNTLISQKNRSNRPKK
jgi:hypothetical protein